MDNKRLGVFICHCGGNISDYVDVDMVRDAVKNHERVAIAKTNMFSCSDSAQQEMIQAIKTNNLNALVIASCTPKLHSSTFRAMCERAGLNKYQYVQVNIREQCSWAHTHDKNAATKKALSLVLAGIARAAISPPLKALSINTVPNVLVIGAGASGLRASLALADMGLNVYLVEKAAEPGGMIKNWGRLFPNDADGEALAQSLVSKVKEHGNITLFTDAKVIEKKGSLGAFNIKLSIKNKDHVWLDTGAILVTTGFAVYTPLEGEFGFGMNGVITLGQFKELLSRQKGPLEYNGKEIGTITYIYCVGSRQPEGPGRHTYCSRYCCSAAIHGAICASRLNPRINQFHLYRDIRTYGKYELLLNKALGAGSLFLKYDQADPPHVEGENGRLLVRIRDRLTGGEEIEIDTDLVVLVTGMEAQKDQDLLDVLKIPAGKDGFFNEIHPKLRPVETVMDGILIAGTCQGPKTLTESVTSSMAAAAKIAGLLSKGYVNIEPFVARVAQDACNWCGECQKACPYEAIEQAEVDGRLIAKINPALCKGEGACAPACPSGAIEMEGHTNSQIRAMIDAMLSEA